MQSPVFRWVPLAYCGKRLNVDQYVYYMQPLSGISDALFEVNTCRRAYAVPDSMQLVTVARFLVS